MLNLTQLYATGIDEQLHPWEISVGLEYNIPALRVFDVFQICFSRTYDSLPTLVPAQVSQETAESAELTAFTQEFTLRHHKRIHDVLGEIQRVLRHKAAFIPAHLADVS